MATSVVLFHRPGKKKEMKSNEKDKCFLSLSLKNLRETISFSPMHVFGFLKEKQKDQDQTLNNGEWWSSGCAISKKFRSDSDVIKKKKKG